MSESRHEEVSAIFFNTPDPAWDSLARLASRLLQAPIAAVTWCDGERLWFKARVGFARESDPLGLAICRRTIAQRGIVSLPDLRDDPELASIYGALRPEPRAYLGLPLWLPNRAAVIGTLFIVDVVPRTFGWDEHAIIEDLAQQAQALIDARHERRRAELARRDEIRERERVVSAMAAQQALEQRLRLAEARLELAMRTGEHGAWEWITNTSDVICSASWYDLFGVDRALSMSDQNRAFLANVHPDDVAPTTHNLMACLRGETPLYEAEYRYDRSGEQRWIYACGRISERAADGTATRMVGISTDITRHKQAAAEMRVIAARLEQAEVNADLGHWHLDAPDGQIVWSRNMFALFRRDPALGPPTLGESFGAVVAEDRERFTIAVSRAVDGGDSWSVEYRARRGDGEVRTFLSRGRMRPDPAGRRVCEAAEMDITDLVRSRDALAHAKEEALLEAGAKAEFLATLSHEIRTPLNGVLGMLELLASTELGSDQRSYVEIAKSSGTWLMALVSDVLDLSRIDANQVPLEDRPFALVDLLHDVVEVVAEQAQAKGIEVWVDICPEVPDAFSGDAQRIRQIMLNLVANAVRVTDHGEVVIRVRAVRDGPLQRVALSVCDTGPGITPERLAQLFVPFGRGEQARQLVTPAGLHADPTRARRQGGTGLGLVIAQRFASHMGGHIHVASTLGHGATFTLELPMRAAPAEPPPFELAPGTNVLFVGQRRGQTIAIERYLSLARANVQVAHRVDEAPRPSIVLVDRDHVDACAEAERARRRWDVPVVLVSAVSDHASVPEGLFRAVLIKPVRRRVLLELVAELVDGRSRAATKPPTEPRQFAGSAVLVAEDNSVNAFLLRKLLERLGCRVDVVDDGAAAVTAMREAHYDLIFMDCVMPVMDGYSATQRIRASERDGRVPIVAITASAIDGDRQRCLAAGMDDYLTKPITGEGIARALERWLG